MGIWAVFNFFLVVNNATVNLKMKLFDFVFMFLFCLIVIRDDVSYVTEKKIDHTVFA